MNTVFAGSLKGLEVGKDVTVSLNMTATPQAATPLSLVSTPASIATQATTVSASGTPSSIEPGNIRGRGRARGRGRPPGMCKSLPAHT